MFIYIYIIHNLTTIYIFIILSSSTYTAFYLFSTSFHASTINSFPSDYSRFWIFPFGVILVFLSLLSSLLVTSLSFFFYSRFLLVILHSTSFYVAFHYVLSCNPNTINDYNNYWSLHAAKNASHLRTSDYTIKITERSMCTYFYFRVAINIGPRTRSFNGVPFP